MMKLRTWTVIELLTVAVIAAAILSLPATDQNWWSYLLSLWNRLNPLR